MSVRLATDQFLAGEFHEHPAIRRRGDEAVVLFRGDPRQRLEPVCEMCRSILDCPVLHGVSDRIGHGQIQPGSFLNGALQRVVHIPGQAGFHHTAVKDHASEKFLVQSS